MPEKSYDVFVSITHCDRVHETFSRVIFNQMVFKDSSLFVFSIQLLGFFTSFGNETLKSRFEISK